MEAGAGAGTETDRRRLTGREEGVSQESDEASHDESRSRAAVEDRATGLQRMRRGPFGDLFCDKGSRDARRRRRSRLSSRHLDCLQLNETPP